MKAPIIIISMLMVLSGWAQEPVAQEPIRKYSRKPSFTVEGTDSCLHCHSGEKMRAMSASPHFDLETRGTPAAERGCESCHGPGSIHASRAHGGQGFPPLTRFDRRNSLSPREEQLSACLSCHGDEEMGEKQIVYLGGTHDRRNINCSTCHSVHTESDPISEKENQDSTCGRCHRRHIREHPRFEEKGIDFEAVTCSTCHDVHAPAKEEG